MVTLDFIYNCNSQCMDWYGIKICSLITVADNMEVMRYQMLALINYLISYQKINRIKDISPPDMGLILDKVIDNKLASCG